MANAKSSGEWLHVDFEAHLRGFHFETCGFVPTDAGLIHLRRGSLMRPQSGLPLRIKDAALNVTNLFDKEVTNLFDKEYVSGCSGVLVCGYGDARTVTFKLSRKW
ncbi:hypothetical protein MZK49_10160 [Ensifer sesbaniae]|uniref:hypothetical protein n=1 Tax=Ensifer sesbaniae TaxID=1214071 RepID=UPI001AEF2851|nr:hypothetical protein [Ensifer sesbaniae]MCK3777099.1 hypothetical protein [Ensifer sesbaniae]